MAAGIEVEMKFVEGGNIALFLATEGDFDLGGYGVWHDRCPIEFEHFMSVGLAALGAELKIKLTNGETINFKCYKSGEVPDDTTGIVKVNGVNLEYDITAVTDAEKLYQCNEMADILINKKLGWYYSGAPGYES